MNARWLVNQRREGQELIPDCEKSFCSGSDGGILVFHIVIALPFHSAANKCSCQPKFFSGYSICFTTTKFVASGKIDFQAALGFTVAAGKTDIAKLLSREGALMEPRDIVQGEILYLGDTIGVIDGELLMGYA